MHGWIWERCPHQLKETHQKRREGSFFLLDNMPALSPRILPVIFQTGGEAQNTKSTTLILGDYKMKEFGVLGDGTEQLN